MSRNSGRTDRKAGGGLAGLGSAAAIVGAGIAAMATGSVPTAAPQADHSDVQTATLTQATIGGTGTGTGDNAGFVTRPAPLTTIPSLSGSPAPKTTPVIPGVTQDTTSSANNPGGNASTFLPTTDRTGIAATPNGLSLNVSTSNNDLLGFGNVGVAPALKVGVNTDGVATVTPGGFFGISTPLGGGTSTFGFPVTIDANGNAKFTAWDNFLNGLANLPSGKNVTNTAGFADMQLADPNYDTNAPFGGTFTGVDPFTKQTFAGATNIVNATQASDAAAAVNSLNVPTIQQLFGDATPGSLLGVPGLGNAAAGNFSTFGAIAPTSDNAVNTFAPRDPANPSAVGIPQDFANIDAMFPNSVNSFAPVSTSSGIPTFQQAYPWAAPASTGDTSPTGPAASPSLPAPSATATGTGLTTGDLAAVSDPNAATATANASAAMVTDPTQLPTIYQIAQSSGITVGEPSSS
jgi:hypothetical protein